MRNPVLSAIFEVASNRGGPSMNFSRIKLLAIVIRDVSEYIRLHLLK
jgi:hypothetical protein